MKAIKTVLLIFLISALGAIVFFRLGPEAPSLLPAATPGAAAETGAPSGAEDPAGQTASVSPSPAPTQAPSGEPEYFTVSMIGDCTLSAAPARVGWGIGFQLTVGDDMAYPFANTVQFLDDDYLTIANLECSLSDNKYTSIEQFTFLGKADYAQILSKGSVEFVTLANNHTMDFGQAAYDDTTAALDAVGVRWAGENECFIYQTDGGLKIGLYCLYNGLTGNAFSRLSAAAQEKKVAESREMIAQAVKTLEAQGAEYTIACLHMGTEGNYETTDVQVELCRYAIDAGFGSVYCTHAHRLQPAELYGDGIIFYGMGNWVFGGNTNPGVGKDPAAYDTGIAQITLCRQNGKVTLDSSNFIPCSISSTLDPVHGEPGSNTVNNYQPTPYKEEGKAWKRAMSIISGTYEGANYAVGNYWDILSRMNG
ncbi:MAG: CapA family protein [Oscillospiraceae bacterium]|nr:CapA family protein [Oscillospiraceae bacterium]